MVSPFIQEILSNYPDRRKFPENLEYFKQKLRVHVDINKKIMLFANGKIKKISSLESKIIISRDNIRTYIRIVQGKIHYTQITYFHI